MDPKNIKTCQHIKIDRKKTREVRIGDLSIGGKNPVVVQEMTTSYTANIDETVDQIKRLEDYGCRLMRVAVQDIPSAKAIGEIKKRIRIPVIADIHFDYKLALLALENGADKLRINPGNIGGLRKVALVVSSAKEKGIPIRVGVNSGSLNRDILHRYGGITPEGLVESALKEVLLLEKHSFYSIIISLKASDIDTTVKANRIISSRLDYPLHIGITESGYGDEGIIRSSIGIGTLLLRGIGDTVRISLTTRDRIKNLKVCYSILDELGIPYI